ncbi:hypothetical protein GIB67_024561 [Kingdonia uniflora]|uniref:lysine--tRNA ligase n=1 Tax=Kingdonia uniflora TaxID=39325 RepID=A0A7J7LPA5_9MAGN|nr:hypothetical protein GIB67_024561 [Kingdonia uniflora]
MVSTRDRLKQTKEKLVSLLTIHRKPNSKKKGDLEMDDSNDRITILETTVSNLTSTVGELVEQLRFTNLVKATSTTWRGRTHRRGRSRKKRVMEVDEDDGLRRSIVILVMPNPTRSGRVLVGEEEEKLIETQIGVEENRFMERGKLKLERRNSCFRCNDDQWSTVVDRRITAGKYLKVEELRSKGYEPYAYTWDRTHNANQLQDIYRDLGNGEEAAGKDDLVSIAGRIVARRAFGKLVFLTLRDDSGSIQLYIEKERLSDDQFDQLKTLIDIGDILGASGSIKRTEKGELSVYVNSFAILTKSLLPLPDKYHGLTDIDTRYRQR